VKPVWPKERGRRGTRRTWQPIDAVILNPEKAKSEKKEVKKAA
jgi:hypothetical protein